MALQLRFFTIPVRNPREAEGELNRFLASVRVVDIHREFVAQGEGSFWSIAVEGLTGEPGPAGEAGGKRKRRIDYKEVLSPEDFAVYARLREWRKQAAGQEAVPVYTIFTNEQLAAMVERKVASRAALMEIDGIGEARAAKYGAAVIDILAWKAEGDSPEADA
jgi:superfamily II DNA helicase RecQ